MKRVVEWTLASIGAAVCIGAASVIWGSQASAILPGQTLWPLPGIYLVEISLLGVVGLVSVISNRPSESPSWGAVTWAIAGALLAFVVLGALSIGPLLLPALAAFWIAAILGDIRRGQSIIRHLGFFVIAGVIQAGLMFAVIALVHPEVQWG